MFTITFLVAVASIGLVAAQDQVIQVGGNSSSQGGIFQFIPASINATVGSVITFNFSGVPGAHSVRQSSFASPCESLAGGFGSGFVELPGTPAPAALPTWNLTISNASAPIWFYCQQVLPSPHCIAGMVGAINAPTTGNTFASFQQASGKTSGTPGQDAGGLSGINAFASAPPSPLNTPGVSGLNNPTQAAGTGGAASGSAGSAGSSGSATASGAAPSSTSSQSGATSIAAGIVTSFAAAAALVALNLA